MIFRRKARRDQTGDGLVEEIESFLTGNALRSYVASGLPVPTWANINWLAHGEPAELRERVRLEYGLERLEGSWAWAVSTVARELLEAGGADPVVVRLQRDCLVPIELALLEQGDREFLPARLVSIGIPRLRAHPMARHTS
jgi:hypothetical protein